MNTSASAYPIGTPSIPWGEKERADWRARQQQQRSHHDDVVIAIRAFADRFDVVAYGSIDDRPLLAVMSRPQRDDLPWVLVTGGVHGYETSGVHGALAFLHAHAAAYAGRVNLVVVPCVSPWAYEHVQRWNADAVDPNRSFKADGTARESMALRALIAERGLVDRTTLHIDLHETTDTDETEFRPALAARDGKTYAPGTIPNGFYLVDDSARLQPAFQAALIAAVQKVTHIAPADDQGELIGSPVLAPGVIAYDVKGLGLCTGLTNAKYTTTTEVYPDAPGCSPDECNRAQVAAVCAGIDFVLAASAHHVPQNVR